MEILEIKSTSFPDARELPNKRGRPISKHQKSPGGNAGAKHTRYGYLPRLTGRALGDLQNADRTATASGKKVLVITAGRKRRFIGEVDYQNGNW